MLVNLSGDIESGNKGVHNSPCDFLSLKVPTARKSQKAATTTRSLWTIESSSALCVAQLEEQSILANYGSLAAPPEVLASEGHHEVGVQVEGDRRNHKRRRRCGNGGLIRKVHGTSPRRYVLVHTLRTPSRLLTSSRTVARRVRKYVIHHKSHNFRILRVDAKHECMSTHTYLKDSTMRKVSESSTYTCLKSGEGPNPEVHEVTGP